MSLLVMIEQRRDANPGFDVLVTDPEHGWSRRENNVTVERAAALTRSMCSEAVAASTDEAA